MAEQPGPPPDAARAHDSPYDYRSDDVERPDLEAALAERVDGEVRADSYSRELYATDASLYEATPVAVVFPTSTADVSATVSYCAGNGVPVLPRGGGTSLAGQAVNEAVVLDFTRHMDAVVDVDPDARRARAQPGVTLAELNDRLADHDLKFAPDPAWGDKSVLGGAIGNNSTGSHSLQYGKTDAYLESVEAVLADGTVTTFGEVAVDELDELADPGGDPEGRIYAAVARILDEHGDEIAERYPDLKRNVSGYNLDWLVEDLRGEPRGSGEPVGVGDTVNVAKLLCGSEGTLAVVTAAEVSLEPVPATKGMALLTYEELGAAMEDVEPILSFDPAAVELVDDVLIDLARERPEFRPVVEQLPDGTAATLLVEFYAGDDAEGRRRVAELLADRAPGVDADGEPPENPRRTDAPVHAFDAVEAHDPGARKEIWTLRKAGLPILLSRTTDAKHVSFVEDTAVPPAHLPAFVDEFQAILDDHGTFASFYAHAGPGVLHVRPLVDIKTVEGVERMASIADAVTDLVVEHGGSVSGEHGDGRARTQWNRKLYGDEIWAAFRELKSAFDPDWLLNPGQVVARPEDPADMSTNLRFGPDYDFDAGFEPALEWNNENGMQGMVELCHGCGGCRGPQETTGGVMCPTFRASEEEITSTRGRANALRQAMDGDLPDDVTDDEFISEVLALCVGCKGCKTDCPSGVDMAKLKAEVTHAHHREHGASLRDRLFANVDRLSALGSAFAPLSNLASSFPGSGLLAEKTLGIARERDLPTFHRETVHDWFDERGGSQVAPGDARRRAVLLVDSDTNHAHPAVGRAAVTVLEAMGVHVALADTTDSGRPAHSRGLLDRSRSTARANVERFAPRVEDGRDVVCVEPSDAVMFQSDYRDLLGDEAAPVPENAYGVCEYVDRFELDATVEFAPVDEHLTYHGHCHQKATRRDHHAVGVLRRAGYAVTPLDSGCCGMAGSFGYEAEHYEMSRAIGRILFDQVDDSQGDSVVAPGTSCRTQLGDREDREAPPHPVEKLAELVEAV